MPQSLAQIARWSACLLLCFVAAPVLASAVAGDLDGDGDVDDADFGQFFAAFSGPGVLTDNPDADLDQDGDVDDADFGLAFAAFTGPRPVVPSRPNIVLIMTDDMGYETLGSYGGTSYNTPNLDALAANGISFDFCHAQPVCTPSRVKIMTGRSNIRNYIDFNILDPDETTFGHILQNAGYRTLAAGKWQLYGSDHRRNPGTGMHPSVAGFDQHLLWQVETLVGPNQLPFNQRDNRYWGAYLNRNGTEAGYPAGSIEYTSTDYSTDLFIDFALDFISAESDDPFFVYLPLINPHNPFQRTPDSADLTAGNRYQNSTAHFDDMVAYIDKSVGRLLDHLEAEGKLNDTIIIFTGDNGTNRSITSQTTSGPVTGGKNGLTDTGTRVPLIVSWPDGQPQWVRGTRSDLLIDFSDFVPTLAEAADTPLPTTMVVDGQTVPAVYDGRSILPAFAGQTATERPWIYCYHNRDGGTLAASIDGQWARTHRYKLYGPGGVSRSNNFYDLVNDPNELSPLDTNNLAGDAAAKFQLLSNAIVQMTDQQTVRGSRNAPAVNDSLASFVRSVPMKPWRPPTQ